MANTQGRTANALTMVRIIPAAMRLPSLPLRLKSSSAGIRGIRLNIQPVIRPGIRVAPPKVIRTRAAFPA